MNNEEVIRQIEELKFKLMKCHYRDIELLNEDDEYKFDFQKALSIAIETSEKQIPKKPTGSSYCPICGRVVFKNSSNYCEHCGQKIDWGEDNEV